jgi:hypothetical protein
VDRQSLTLLLAERLLSLYGKETLSSILAEIKTQPKVKRSAFRVSGVTNQELLEEIPKALEFARDLPERIASAIDRIEENGAQHVFLFRFATSGRGAVTRARFQSIAELPDVPPPSLYSGIPSSPKLYRRESKTKLLLKQVRRATYEEFDRESAEAGGRAVYYRTVETRAVNVMRLDFASGEAEIRIDRARNRQDDELAIKLFELFVDDLRKAIDFDALESFDAVSVWTPATFGRMLDARNETHMSADTFRDPSVRMNITSLREEDKGKDIRDHPSWLRNAERKFLRIYWNVPVEEGDKEEADNPIRLHTVVSSVEVTAKAPEPGGPISRHRVGKVYVAARTSPKKIEHATTRIRHFAR